MQSPFPSFSFSPHLSPGSFFPLSEVPSVCHQVALNLSGREFWSLHCSQRCGDQVSRTPAIPNSPQSQMERPQRPLRKKKIKESSSLQGKSKVKWQPNSTSSGPAERGATAELCRSLGSCAIAMRHGTNGLHLAGSPEECWWGRNAPRSLHAHPTPVVAGRAGVTTLQTTPQCPAPWPQERQRPGWACASQVDKAHSVYRFFPCGHKIKEWERNLGYIIVSWWSTPSTQPCRPSKTSSFYPRGQAGLGWIQNGLQHNPIHKEGYFWKRIFFFPLADCQK